MNFCFFEDFVRFFIIESGTAYPKFTKSKFEKLGFSPTNDWFQSKFAHDFRVEMAAHYPKFIFYKKMNFEFTPLRCTKVNDFHENNNFFAKS